MSYPQIPRGQPGYRDRFIPPQYRSGAGGGITLPRLGDAFRRAVRIGPVRSAPKNVKPTSAQRASVKVGQALRRAPSLAVLPGLGAGRSSAPIAPSAGFARFTGGGADAQTAGVQDSTLSPLVIVGAILLALVVLR